MRLRPLAEITRTVAAPVIKPLRLSSLTWLAVPLGALALLVGVNAVRIRHIAQVSAQGGWEGKPPVATSPASELTAGNGLIVPE